MATNLLFGENFSVKKDVGKELRILTSKELLPGIIKARENLFKIGNINGKYKTVFTQRVNIGFGVSKNASAVPQVFFWNHEDLFTIEIVNSMDDINKKEEPCTPKLFLITNGKKPYYYHFQKKHALTSENITQQELEYIKDFEEGLGLLYDSGKVTPTPVTTDKVNFKYPWED